MASNLSLIGSADIDYQFTIIPQDKFNNVVDSSEPEINMLINWPNTSD